jgi:hypothetical protein
VCNVKNALGENVLPGSCSFDAVPGKAKLIDLDFYRWFFKGFGNSLLDG